MRITWIATGLLIACAAYSQDRSATTQQAPSPAGPATREGSSTSAPADQPVHAAGQEEVDRVNAAIAPYIREALKTYPDARKRYQQGLPRGHRFFVVTRIRDGSGAFEQVFIRVSNITDDQITGRIATQVNVVSGYKLGDSYKFSDRDLIDWLISHPGGTEEGNVVGKFLDEWQKKNGQTKEP